jgi:hypothetical protein
MVVGGSGGPCYILIAPIGRLILIVDYKKNDFTMYQKNACRMHIKRWKLVLTLFLFPSSDVGTGSGGRGYTWSLLIKSSRWFATAFGLVRVLVPGFVFLSLSEDAGVTDLMQRRFLVLGVECALDRCCLVAILVRWCNKKWVHVKIKVNINGFIPQ